MELELLGKCTIAEKFEALARDEDVGTFVVKTELLPGRIVVFPCSHTGREGKRSEELSTGLT